MYFLSQKVLLEWAASEWGAAKEEAEATTSRGNLVAAGGPPAWDRPWARPPDATNVALHRGWHPPPPPQHFGPPDGARPLSGPGPVVYTTTQGGAVVHHVVHYVMQHAGTPSPHVPPLALPTSNRGRQRPARSAAVMATRSIPQCTTTVRKRKRKIKGDSPRSPSDISPQGSESTSPSRLTATLRGADENEAELNGDTLIQSILLNHEVWPPKKYRVAKFDRDDLTRMRLHRSAAYPHRVIKAPGKTCSLCLVDRNTKRNTRWACDTCGINLCTVPLSGETSTCFALWHACEDLSAAHAMQGAALKRQRQGNVGNPKFDHLRNAMKLAEARKSDKAESDSVEAAPTKREESAVTAA